MSDIFISYRRGMASPYARGVYERLEQTLGSGRVFMDIDTMKPGVDFVDYIERAVGSCKVLIVVIAPDWVAAVDDTGRRRIDDPEDFVRVEVKAALEREDVRVIPVLVGHATPPVKGDLPDDLAALTRRHALEVSDSRWDHDLGLLVRTVQEVLADDQAPAPPGPLARPEPEPSGRRRAVLAIAAAGVVALAVAAIVIASGSSDDDGTGSSPDGQASDAIPATNPCRREDDGTMVVSFGADAHFECRLKTSPPPADLGISTLMYGRYSSAAKARTAFDDGLLFENEEGAQACPQSSLRRMEDAFPDGDTACFVNGADEYIMLWWNGDASRVFGQLIFPASTHPDNAVDAWERVLTGPSERG